ncbi:LCR-like protein [Medicago truncatula]|uniref:LCR-like protein n=1 Tax=Medicago truncatula TaxID=3880 RepID=A0A072V726_MEDTR|nr:LCR-like protein [Medicago truncatula]
MKLSLLILFFLSLLISSSSSVTTAEEPICDPNNVRFIRILYCKNSDCLSKCLEKYGTSGTKNPNCNGRDTCVCCNDK